MRTQRRQLMEALQSARREHDAAATVIEEIGGPSPAAHGGVWSGVVAAPGSPNGLSAVPPMAVPTESATGTAAQGLVDADATPTCGTAGPAAASRKRKPFSDAAESGVEQHVSKRVHVAPQISDDAMDVA